MSTVLDPIAPVKTGPDRLFHIDLLCDPLAMMQSDGPSPYVLLVDDEPTNRLVYSSMLRAAGFECRTASCGDAAVDLCIHQPVRPELVLMDLEMKPLDGFGAAAAIRGLELARMLPRLPIVAFTGNVVHNTLERVTAAGMDSLLHKPCTLDQMRMLCYRILGRRGEFLYGPVD